MDRQTYVEIKIVLFMTTINMHVNDSLETGQTDIKIDLAIKFPSYYTCAINHCGFYSKITILAPRLLIKKHITTT